MLQDHLKNEILKQCHESYYNFWFLVKKKLGKYCIVNIVMIINKITIQDTYLSSDCKEFSEKFVGMTALSCLNFLLGYDQIELHPECCDMIAFQTSLELLCQTTLLQETTNSVSQFQQVAIRILESNIPHDCQVYINDILVKGLKTKYNNKEILSEM